MKQEDYFILEFLKQRHFDLLSIKNSIEEIHEMYLSMAILIDLQKEKINSIEANCNSIKEYSIEINSNLDKSYKLKKKFVVVCFFYFIFILNRIIQKY